MNPNENNPISPAGAGGAAAGTTPYAGTASGSAGVTADGAASSNIAAPVDFTNLSDSSLSMSDSLASAQDNLTSAGQAANVASHTPELNQLGADKPEAEMASPSQPLTPAAPLPGSLGSVSSGAPVSSTPTTSSAMPVMGGGANSEGVGTTASSTGPAAGSAGGAVGGAGNAAAQPYYNPFASASSVQPTSATTASVPPALQPQAAAMKNATGAARKGHSVMSLLAWIVAVILAGTTVLFAVLWQMAENKPPKIQYVDRPVENVGNEGESGSAGKGAISCTQESTDTYVEGIGMVPSISRTMNGMSGSDGLLSDIALIENYSLADVDMESAAIAYLDAESSRLSTRAFELGIDQVGTNFGVSDLRAIFTKSANAAQIDGGFAGEFLLPVGEDGAVEKSLASVQQVYEDAGFVCEMKSLEN